jgi:hypothetical protein
VRLILEPGASVAEVARAHGVNANQMFEWRRAFERGELTQPCSALLLASASFVRDAGKCCCAILVLLAPLWPRLLPNHGKQEETRLGNGSRPFSQVDRS